MPGVTLALAAIDALNHERPLRDGLQLRVFELWVFKQAVKQGSGQKEGFIERAWAAPRSRKYQHKVLVPALCLGFGLREQSGHGFWLGHQRGCAYECCNQGKFSGNNRLG